MGISGLCAAPARPSGPSATAVARVAPQNDRRTLLVVRWQFGARSERRRPEPRLRGSASVCIVPGESTKDGDTDCEREEMNYEDAVQASPGDVSGAHDSGLLVFHEASVQSQIY